MSDEAYRYAQLAEAAEHRAARRPSRRDAPAGPRRHLPRRRPDADTALLLPPEEAIGRHVYDVLPAELATTVLACIERTLETRSLHTIEYEIEIDGVARWKEARMVPSGDERGRVDLP